MQKYFAILSLLVITALGLQSCEIGKGGSLLVKNNHDVNIKVTIYGPNRKPIFSDALIEAKGSRSFQFEENGTYTIESDKGDIGRDLVSNGMDSSITFPVSFSYDEKVDFSL